MKRHQQGRTTSTVTMAGPHIPSAVMDSGNGLPIFNVSRVDMQFSVASDFVAAQVSNNVLVLALQSGRILRINLDQASDVDGMSL